MFRGILTCALVLAGCVKGGNSPFDAMVDAGIDANPHPATQVRVLFENGTPVPRIHVFFNKANGLLAEETETNDDGYAIVFEPDVASMTIAFEEGGQRQLFTRFGVIPTDSFVYILPSSRAQGTVRYDLPALAGADEYAAYTPCGSVSAQTPNLALDVDATCVNSNGAIEALFVASQGGDRIGFASLSHGTPGPNKMLDYVGPAWTTQNLSSVSYNLVGLNGWDAGQFDAGVRLLKKAQAPFESFIDIQGGQSSAMSGALPDLTALAGGVIRASLSQGQSTNQVIEHVDAFAQKIYDSSDFLGKMSGTYESVGGTVLVSWQYPGSQNDGLAIVTVANYGNTRWEIWQASKSSGTLFLPQLSSEVGAWAPTAFDTVDVTLLSDSRYSSYRELIKTSFERLDRHLLAASGVATLRLATWQNP